MIKQGLITMDRSVYMRQYKNQHVKSVVNVRQMIADDARALKMETIPSSGKMKLIPKR